MNKLKIKKLLKEYNCQPGKHFAYSSSSQAITYAPKEVFTPKGFLALLHEISHAKLNHFNYDFDLELLEMEKEAWNEVKKEAHSHKVVIDENHIEECLSSYTSWITKRSSCPVCATFGLQKSHNTFQCFSCQTRWVVNERKDRRVLRKII